MLFADVHNQTNHKSIVLIHIVHLNLCIFDVSKYNWYRKRYSNRITGSYCFITLSIYAANLSKEQKL